MTVSPIQFRLKKSKQRLASFLISAQMPLVSVEAQTMPNQWQRAAVESSKAERETLWEKSLF
jgi:hypothetical protein